MNVLRRWVHHRAHHGPASHAHVSAQRSRSLYLLVFGIVRIIAWMILGACIAAGLAHVPLFGWAATLSASVPFVAMISVYANWATDLDAATAAFAALVAADGHATAVSGSPDLAALGADVARLAAMQPGAEADALAGEIRRKLDPKGHRS